METANVLNELLTTDVLVIGSGIAGATTALNLATKLGYKVVVATRAQEPSDTNTDHAQGGIIGPGVKDSAELLTVDILKAGDGVTLPRAAEILATEGPYLVVKFLVDEIGVDFDTHNGKLSATLEGGHSRNRVVHKADATGHAIEVALIKAMQNEPNITLLTGATVVDLLTPQHHSVDRLEIYDPVSCVGAYLLDQTTGKVVRCLAKATVLATGGYGRLFAHTTNPVGARGDGIAIAHRAGARVMNLQYMQFHPTTFFHPLAERFLISEAVRGEGARLVDADGVPFMQDYEPLLLKPDLATRDKVTRAIFAQMRKTGAPCVFLDLKSYISREKILKRFPTIYANLLKYGVDITKDLVPVVPAAHYSCGGVWTDVETAQTSIANLYAVGEVACNGLHGANRLASTSLLEGLVWGFRAAVHITNRIDAGLPLVEPTTIAPWITVGSGEDDLADLIIQDTTTIRSTMWNYVGPIRSRAKLERARKDLRALEATIESQYQNGGVSDLLIGLRNMIHTACLVADAAWADKINAGCHYREN